MPSSGKLSKTFLIRMNPASICSHSPISLPLIVIITQINTIQFNWVSLPHQTSEGKGCVFAYHFIPSGGYNVWHLLGTQWIFVWMNKWKEKTAWYHIGGPDNFKMPSAEITFWISGSQPVHLLISKNACIYKCVHTHTQYYEDSILRESIIFFYTFYTFTTCY